VERLGALDGLRALAAIAVVGFHVRLPGLEGGFLGVDVFFVLSGYLITSLLLTELEDSGRLDIPKFWWRRVVRLVPALLLMLAGVALLMPRFFPGKDVLTEVLLSGFYVSNISQVVAQLPEVTGHTWSLATEMQFYLIWPFVLLYILRRSPRHAALVLLVLYLLTSFWRWQQFWDAGWIRAYYPPDTRLSGLVLGALLATVKWRPSPGGADLVAFGALGTLAVFAWQPLFYFEPASTWGGSVVEIATALLIAALLTGNGRLAALLAHPLLVRLGLWSYGIYLWHYPIARVARVELDPLTAFVVTLTLSTLLAALSYHLVEQPLRKMLRPARLPLAQTVSSA
jgi:peptidoglycan/LPS O-acetylase OafA/YrhL